MTEKNYAPSTKENKVSKKASVAAPVTNAPAEIVKTENEQKEIKKEVKKVEVKITPKANAVVRGNDLHISKKHSMSIFNMIKGKTPEKAIEMLDEVVIMKRAVPMNNREVPHKHGMMAGRYPVNAAKVIIDLLKQLKANASVNSVDNPIIFLAKADKASRPHRRGGTRAKRTNVYLEARDRTKLGLK